MVAGFVHSMITAEDQESGLEVSGGFYGFIYLLDDGVHLNLFGNHVGTIFIRYPSQTVQSISGHTFEDRIYVLYDPNQDNA